MKGFKVPPLLFLVGCAVGPNYESPQVALPSSYHEPHDKTEEDLSDLKEWWASFNDPLLNVLVHEALSQNLDLKIAVEKIHQVRKGFRHQRPPSLAHRE